MCVNHIPSPMDNARRKVEHIYTGLLDTELAESMFDCSPEVTAASQCCRCCCHQDVRLMDSFSMTTWASRHQKG